MKKISLFNKFLTIIFSLVCLLNGTNNVYAQAKKELVSGTGFQIDYELNKMLNGTRDGKIKTIELKQIKEAFDNKTYNVKTTQYLYKMNGWKEEGYKASILGVITIESGLIYVYALITPKNEYKVCYGIQLVADQKIYDYDVNDFYKVLYVQSEEAVYAASSVLIKVKSAGKKPVFNVLIKSSGTTEKTYTVLPAQVDKNPNWIEMVMKSGK